VIGRPISEAYWAEVSLNGRVQTVLVQLFERRVLTYNPANPARFRVEFGNAGMHYYMWRYASPEARSNRVEQLLSHFETGEQALNGNFWFSFDDRNDGGTSSATNRLIGPGVWGSVRAMRAIPFSFAEMALNLDSGGVVRDLRGVSAVGFWARGDGRSFSVRISSAYADEPYTATFSAPGDGRGATAAASACSSSATSPTSRSRPPSVHRACGPGSSCRWQASPSGPACSRSRATRASPRPPASGSARPSGRPPASWTSTT
jgi:hypothetical protein